MTAQDKYQRSLRVVKSRRAALNAVRLHIDAVSAKPTSYYKEKSNLITNLGNLLDAVEAHVQLLKRRTVLKEADLRHTIVREGYSSNSGQKPERRVELSKPAMAHAVVACQSIRGGGKTQCRDWITISAEGIDSAGTPMYLFHIGR